MGIGIINPYIKNCLDWRVNFINGIIKGVNGISIRVNEISD